MHKRQPVPIVSKTAASVDASSDDEDVVEEKQQVPAKKHSVTLHSTKFHHGSKGALPSPLGSAHSFDLQVSNWRMEKLEVDSKSGSEEEFYDCLGESGNLSAFFLLRFNFFLSLAFNFIFTGCMWVGF